MHAPSNKSKGHKKAQARKTRIQVFKSCSHDVYELQVFRRLDTRYLQRVDILPIANMILRQSALHHFPKF